MSENQNPAVIEMCDVQVGTLNDPDCIMLEDVNWTVTRGEIWVVAGQQGSGKTDLLMMTAGVMPPVKGSYKLFGTETRLFGEAELTERLRVGCVFETGQLFNRLTIAENVALPLQYHHNLPNTVAAQEALKLLELMDLAPLAGMIPPNVSANWSRRVALARALAMKPEVLLLDNPLGGLVVRHLQWWTRFLDKLRRGHEWLEGRPMTIVATADDLRPWRNDAARFALLRDRRFKPLGSWGEVSSQDDAIVKDLLTLPFETTT